MSPRCYFPSSYGASIGMFSIYFIVSFSLQLLSSLQLQTVPFPFYETLHSLRFLNYLFPCIPTCKIFLFNMTFHIFLVIFTITTRVHAIYTDRLLLIPINLYVQCFVWSFFNFPQYSFSNCYFFPFFLYLPVLAAAPDSFYLLSIASSSFSYCFSTYPLYIFLNL